MRRVIWGVVVVATLWACGGSTLSGGADAGGDGSSSSSGSGSGSGAGSSSGGGSGSSSGAASSSSGGSGSGSSSGASSGSSSSGSGSGSSSGSSSGGVPVNHRPDDSQCLQPAPAGNCSAGGGGGGICSTDAQCADAGIDGRCINFGGGPPGCFCTSDACADDAACNSGQTCACHGAPYTNGAGNHCVSGNCRVDADCGVGGWCSPSDSTMSCGEIGGYYCHTPKDQCVNDSDCANVSSNDLCGYDTSLGYWRCMMQVICFARRQ